MSQGLVKFEGTAKEELATEAMTAQELVNLTADMVIDSQADLELASEALAQVKGEWKRLEERKKAVTGPLTAALNEVRAWFKPAQSYYERAETGLKKSIADYHERVAQANAAAMALAAQAAAENDTVAVMTAISSVHTTDKVKGLSVREVWDFEVTDITQVPHDYLYVNDALVKKYVQDSPGDPLPLPGIRFFKRSIVASRAK